MIAPKIPPSTIPPAPILSKKLFNDGVTPDAACATSGTTIEAARTVAVNAVTVFSFNELFTTNGLYEDDVALTMLFFEETLSGLKKQVVVVGGRVVLWVIGMAMEIAEVEAIEDDDDRARVCVL